MSIRNERFTKRFVSLGAFARELDRCGLASDRGAAVERLVDGLDRTPADIRRDERMRNENLVRKFHAAEMRLRRAGCGYLVPTLVLICRNGRRRDESIAEIAVRERVSWQAAKSRYFAHRKKIENILFAQ